MPSFTTGEPKQGGASFLLEPGEYDLRIIDAKESQSKGGDAMLEVVFRAQLADGSDGPKIFEYLVFIEKMMWKIDNFLAACGKHPGQGKNFDLYPSLMFGWTCRARLKVEEYNGKQRNKVEEYIIDPETVGVNPDSGSARTENKSHRSIVRQEVNKWPPDNGDEDQVPF